MSDHYRSTGMDSWYDRLSTAAGFCRGWEAETTRKALLKERPTRYGPPLPEHIKEQRIQEGLERSAQAYQDWLRRENEIAQMRERSYRDW